MRPSILLAELRVETPSPVTYNRDLFAEGIDADGDGCNTRREVLQAESLVPVTIVGRLHHHGGSSGTRGTTASRGRTRPSSRWITSSR